jgi:hypothetical protein
MVTPLTLKRPTLRVTIVLVANEALLAKLPSAEYSHRLSLKNAGRHRRAIGSYLF